MNNIRIFFPCFIIALNLISFSGYAITNSSGNPAILDGAGICVPASEAVIFSLANTKVFEYIRIVPNPAVSRSRIRIHVRLAADADITIRFYNKLGRELDSLRVQARAGSHGNTFGYSISDYAAGVYFYVIEARSIFGKEKITGQFAVVD